MQSKVQKIFPSNKENIMKVQTPPAKYLTRDYQFSSGSSFLLRNCNSKYFANYRPISIVSTRSKTMESNIRLLSYVTENLSPYAPSIRNSNDRFEWLMHTRVLEGFSLDQRAINLCHFSSGISDCNFFPAPQIC